MIDLDAGVLTPSQWAAYGLIFTVAGQDVKMTHKQNVVKRKHLKRVWSMGKLMSNLQEFTVWKTKSFVQVETEGYKANGIVFETLYL